MHIDGRTRRGSDFASAAKRALEAMESANIVLSLVLPPPQPPGFHREWKCDQYRSLPLTFDKKFALVCGGGTINPLIVTQSEQGAADNDARVRLTNLVETFVKMGAVGLGEFTTEHFSFHGRHPYVSVPADHPLLLQLADLAAKHDMPVELHMEAATGEFVFPDRLRQRSPHNPTRISPNRHQLERLLAHNREAMIVWAHAGWDNTRQRTVRLMYELLDRHSNLHMSVGINPRSPGSQTYMTLEGNLDPAFIGLVERFSDRFVVGTDAFFANRSTPPSRHAGVRIEAIRSFLNQLAPDAARRVAFDNAARIYKLRERGFLKNR